MATILVVDANPLERRVVRMTLEGEGHRLAEAADAARALEILNTVTCDIVLLAMDASEVDGFNLIAKVHAIPGREGTHFIAVLDSSDEKGPIESFINGARDLLIRPFGAPELRLAIDRVMAPESIDLRDRLVGIQLEAYEMAVRLQEQARTGE